MCREDVARQVREQSREGNTIEVEYRLVTKQGETVWVLDKSHLYKGEDGDEYFSAILIDVTQTRRIQDELQFLTERYRIIMEQTNDIICEWDAKKDQLSFSANWIKKFGYEPIREQASRRIPSASHIHPEDLPLFNRLISDIRSGVSYEELDARLADEAGRYCWCKFRVAAQFDGMGNLFKAVSVITDIDADKRASQELQSKAERDSLTMLFNRHAATKKIEALLRQFESGEEAALLLVDVDDFKRINDIYGHMFGDVLLQEIAAELQKIFRSGDIVARVGGDEFLVFMRGVRNREIVIERIETINETFRTVLSQNMEGQGISCCAGVAFYPQDGESLDALLRHSDIALYNAKAKGNKNYELYSKLMDRPFGMPQGLTTATAIDSEPCLDEARQESVVDHVFRVLYETDDTDSAINGILEMAGREYGVSRAYIFEDDGDGLFQSNTYEWCADGISSGTGEDIKLPYVWDGADYRELFSESDVFYCQDITILPQWEREFFSARGIKAMLQCAVRENGVFKGFVGFDDCVVRRIWTKEQIDTLALIAQLLSAFLLKRHAQDRFEADAKNISTIVDAQSVWVVVIDPVDRRVLYRNKAQERNALNLEPGVLCHKALYGKTDPCVDCGLKKISEDSTIHVERTLPDGQTLSYEARWIEWSGKPACLLTGRIALEN